MRIGIVAVAVVVLGLVGCAAKSKLPEQLDSYVGQPVAAVAMKLGQPTTHFSLGDGKMAFQWEQRGREQTGGMATSVGGTVLYSPPQAYETICRLSITGTPFKAGARPEPAALGDWQVVNWEYTGNRC